MNELTFKATSIIKYADTEAITVVDRTISTLLNADELLIKVAHAGLNKADLFLFLGEPKPIKLVYGLKRPKYPFVGSDIAGEVVGIGKDVKGYKVGDKVFGDLSVQKFGAYGEYAVVKDRSIHHAPNNISTKEAAGLPMSASTALIAIQKVAPNKSDNILVYGASGAVGYTLSQILIAKGYKVTLVASKKHHTYLNKLNPVDILDYADPNFKLKDNTYDVIFAVNGYQPIKAYMKALKKRSKLAVIGGDFRQINDAMMKGLFYRIFKRKRALSIMSKSTPETLKEIKTLVEKGQLKQMIGQTYTLDQVKQAYIDFKAGRHVGKYIIEMPAK